MPRSGIAGSHVSPSLDGEVTVGPLTRTKQSLKANTPDYAVETLVRIKPTVTGGRSHQPCLRTGQLEHDCREVSPSPHPNLQGSLMSGVTQPLLSWVAKSHSMSGP